MKKHIIILFCILLSSLSFSALSGTGYGKKEKESRKTALEELTSTISVNVSSEFYNIQSVQDDDYYKNTTKELNVSSDLKLIGVKYETTKENRQYKTVAYLDSSSIPVYTREINQLYEIITNSYDKSKDMESESRLQTLNDISKQIDEYYNYQTIVSLLGKDKTKNLSITKSEIEAEIMSVSKIVNKKNSIFIDKFVGNSEANSLKIIQDKFSGWLISSNRFNVVNNKQDADYIVSGKILSFYVDEIEEIRDRRTHEILEYPAVGTTIQAEVKFYDRNTAKYFVSKTVTGSGFNRGSQLERPDRLASIMEAREDLIYKLIPAVEHEFVIEGKILSVNRGKIVKINKGSDVGIKKHMDFFIYHPDDKNHQNKIAGLRVTNIDETSSIGQIFEVFDSTTSVKSGFLLKEAKETVRIQGRIFQKKRSKVLINLGQNMNINKGDVYYVFDNKNGEIIRDPDTGFVLAERREQLGKIVIMDIAANYAEAKVVRGNFNVKENMFAKESDEKNIQFRIEVKRSIQNAKTVQNKEATYTSGSGYYGNNGTDIISDEKDASQWKLAFGLTGLSWPVNVDLEFASINIDDDVNGIELSLGTRYNFNLIGRTLVAYLGGNFGFGAVTQNDVRNILDSSDYQNSDVILNAGDESVLAQAKAGLEWNMGTLLFGIEAGYKDLKFDNFKYYDGELELKQELNQDGLKYREIDMTGAYYQATFGFEF